MTEDYYMLQAEGSSWTHNTPQYADRLREAIDSLGDLKGLRVADVGCGDGTSTRYIKERGAKHAIGMEYSKEKADYANSRGDSTTTFVAWFDLDRYASPEDSPYEAADSYDEAFDIVFCSHTLEHTRDCVKSTEHLCRMVDEGGRLLLIFPHEEAFPENNPSHTQWMNNDRIKLVKYVLETYFEKVTEERKYRLENECWLLAEEKR